MLIRCVLADDEPMARKILASYIARMPQLELVRSCPDAQIVQQTLASETVDLLFLDIQMPQMTGIELLRNMEKTATKVIFTTAYTEFAFEGFELGVADYLRKPFSFERFLTAVERAFPEIAVQKTEVPTDQARTFLFLKVERSSHRVRISDILYLQGYGNYVKVFTKNGMLLAYERLSDLEQLLPAERFLRVHKSWVVAIESVTVVHPIFLKIGEIEVPISEAKRKLVASILLR
jgi:two-component system, LytTR family, response regulator